MKNLLLVFFTMAFISFNAFTQDAKELPSQVKTAFEKKFPGAEKVKWEKENANEWEAEYTLKGKEYSANFNADGSWLETEYEISEKEIPAPVTKTLAKEFPSYKLEEAELTETAKGKFYEIEIKTGKEEMEVVINPDGTLVKKEVKNEKEEEGKEDKD